jgi:hypothetical protein
MAKTKPRVQGKHAMRRLVGVAAPKSKFSSNAIRTLLVVAEALARTYVDRACDVSTKKTIDAATFELVCDAIERA